MKQYFKISAILGTLGLWMILRCFKVFVQELYTVTVVVGLFLVVLAMYTIFYDKIKNSKVAKIILNILVIPLAVILNAMFLGTTWIYIINFPPFFADMDMREIPKIQHVTDVEYSNWEKARQMKTKKELVDFIYNNDIGITEYYYEYERVKEPVETIQEMLRVVDNFPHIDEFYNANIMDGVQVELEQLMTENKYEETLQLLKKHFVVADKLVNLKNGTTSSFVNGGMIYEEMKAFFKKNGSWLKPEDKEFIQNKFSDFDKIQHETYIFKNYLFLMRGEGRYQLIKPDRYLSWPLYDYNRISMLMWSHVAALEGNNEYIYKSLFEII